MHAMPDIPYYPKSNANKSHPIKCITKVYNAILNKRHNTSKAFNAIPVQTFPYFTFTVLMEDALPCNARVSLVINSIKML